MYARVVEIIESQLEDQLDATSDTGNFFFFLNNYHF